MNLISLLKEHQTALWWIAIGSAIVFIGSLLLVPWLVTRIPADYFCRHHRPRLPFADRHPLLRWSGLLAKNVLGLILIVAGIAMLLLPGQGLLTLVIGVLLIDFPGKHRVEGNIIRRRPIARTVNWLREKAGVEPLQLNQPNADSEAAEHSTDKNPTEHG